MGKQTHKKQLSQEILKNKEEEEEEEEEKEKEKKEKEQKEKRRRRRRRGRRKKEEEEQAYHNILDQVEQRNNVYQAMEIQLWPRKRTYIPSRGLQSESGQKQANVKLQYSTINAIPGVIELALEVHRKGLTCIIGRLPTESEMYQ